MDYSQAMTISDQQHKARAATGTPKGGYNDYARGVRSAVYGLWSGKIDRFSFIDSMVSTIDRGVRRAWFEGASQCGIGPTELTVAEMDAMRELINSQFSYLVNFADDIEAGQKGFGLLSTQYARAELWVNRYNDAINKARIMACRDGKMIWTLGATEESCRTCNALNGKVKRTSTWADAGVKPQNAPNPLIECQGWNCLCSLTSTKKPLSKGPLPNLP
ncbi:MAG: hypothetical protein GQ553_01260 [Nitrosomonadaceae bacterium]|nr:hypothetical protein [Nitrosomonadaceae bacterium]